MRKTLLFFAAFSMMSVVSAQNIVIGKNGAVVTTTDGGETWSDKRPSTGQLIDVVGISKQSPNNWVISQFKSGSGSYIQRTTDGGANYTTIATNVFGTTNYHQEMTHFGPDTLLLLSRVLTDRATEGHSVSNLTTSSPAFAGGGNNRSPHFGLTKLNAKTALAINNNTNGMPFSSSSEVYKYETKTATTTAPYCFTVTTTVYEHNQITAAVRVDATTLFAVGNKNGSSNGSMYKTTDNGASWTTVVLPSVPSGCALLDIALSPNGEILIAIGTKGYLVRSVDKGANWTSVTPTGLPTNLSTWTFNKVAFAADNTVIVGGSDGLSTANIDWFALRSTDGGTSFAAVMTLTIDTYTDFTEGVDRRGSYHSIYFVNSTTGYAVMGRADKSKKYEIMKTTDGGASWSLITWANGAKPNVSSVEILNHIGNENSLVVNSPSSKNLWQIDVTTAEPIAITSIVSKYTAKDLRRAYKKSETELYALEYAVASTDGGIYKSIDGGLSWALHSPALVGQPMLCITDGFVGGYLGRSYMANGDFSTFTRTPVLGHWGGNLIDLSSTYKNLPNTSSAVVYAIGEAGGIFKTTNSGASFVYVGNPEWSGYTYTAVCAVDADNVFICGFNAANKGVIIKTNNGGGDWSKVEFSGIDQLNDIEMYNATQGLAVGNAGVILGTKDGESWISKSPALLTDDLTKVVCDEPVSVSGTPEITTGLVSPDSKNGAYVFVQNNKLHIIAGKGANVVVYNLLGVAEYYTRMENENAVFELKPGAKIVRIEKEGFVSTNKVILR